MIPIGQRIIAKRTENTLEKIGSIIIPERAKTKSQEGTVVAVGSEVTDLKPGDRILFGKYQGMEVEVAGEKLLVLWAKDVMCVLE